MHAHKQAHMQARMQAHMLPHMSGRTITHQSSEYTHTNRAETKRIDGCVTYVCVCMDVRTCMYTHIYTYMYVYAHIYIYIHVYKYMYVCAYICTYVYVYIRMSIYSLGICIYIRYRCVVSHSHWAYEQSIPRRSYS